MVPTGKMVKEVSVFSECLLYSLLSAAVILIDDEQS